VGVDDVVEVPPVALLAPGGGEGRGVARLARVVAVDGRGEHRVGGGVARGPAGQAVQAEVVLGAVGGGDDEVLVVVVVVDRVGLDLDLFAVVALRVPGTRLVVVDQGVGGAVQRQREGVDRIRPAFVGRLR
jgi:hypothetical protein